jgi:hypothetical protein
VHAAYHWSTAAWATLKGIGVPVIFGIYMFIEIMVIRWRVRRDRLNPDAAQTASQENQP